MTIIQAYATYCVVSMILMYLSFRIRASWSGIGYSNSRNRMGFAFFMLCGFFHFTHIHTGKILFSEVTDPSPLKLVSLLLMVVHACCMPSEAERKPWISGKRSRNSILLKEPRLVKTNHYEELFFQALKLITLIVVCSVGLTGVSLAIFVKLFPGIVHVSYYSAAWVFAFYATLYSYCLFRDFKKRGFTI